jgi:CubicO group peptidase (beta-lactamase class C family)
MADFLDGLVAAQMRKHHIPGLSLVVIDDGRIAKVKGYGFTDQTGKSLITDATLFQAASVSKCLAALAALRLVDRGLLSLDEDLNTNLKSWKIPANEFTKNNPVTLRRLLSHNASFTVHGFRGYTVGQPTPMLAQILDGAPPANNAGIRIDAIPGANPRYSGGGYTVLQQLLIDVTGQSFSELMQSLVLQPLRMTSSTFDQPLPHHFKPAAATGHAQNGNPITGGAHVYPELAAAGLWTMPSDLARFVIGIQQSLAGSSDCVLSPSIAREMVTPQAEGHGLGPFIAGNGRTKKFFHSGRNAGFDALLMASAETGKGAVIMINANCDSKALSSILKATSTGSGSVSRGNGHGFAFRNVQA